MFSAEIGLIQNHSHFATTHSRQKITELRPFSQSDLEYQICSKLLKHTGHKFSIREADLIENSRAFLDSFTTLRKKEIGSSRTLDTLREADPEKQITQEQPQNLVFIRPKSPPHTARKHGLVLGQQLTQIEQKCSYSCFLFFSNLLAEYKRQEIKIRAYQSRDFTSFKRGEQSQRFHEQNIILKKKLQHQQQTIVQLETEIQGWKQKNKQPHSMHNEKSISMSHPQSYFEISNKVYKDIKSYLSQKEAILKQQKEKISKTENEVLRSIEVVFEAGNCLKCCQILSKLKDSIMKIRRYLQGECLQFERLYEKYKKTMYSLKSRPLK